LGGNSRRRSPRGLGPDGRDAKPSSILRAGGQGNVSGGDCVRSLAIAASMSLLRDWCGTRHGTKDAAPRFPIGRCEGTLYGALSRRLAG
jgi:hypothetical protein